MLVNHNLVVGVADAYNVQARSGQLDDSLVALLHEHAAHAVENRHLAVAILADADLAVAQHGDTCLDVVGVVDAHTAAAFLSGVDGCVGGGVVVAFNPGGIVVAEVHECPTVVYVVAKGDAESYIERCGDLLVGVEIGVAVACEIAAGSDDCALLEGAHIIPYFGVGYDVVSVFGIDVVEHAVAVVDVGSEVADAEFEVAVIVEVDAVGLVRYAAVIDKGAVSDGALGDLCVADCCKGGKTKNE